jgi:hypothetical protein
MFSRSFRKTYNLHKYSKLSDVDSLKDFGRYNTLFDHKLTNYLTVAVVVMTSLSFYSNTDPFYEILTHFSEPARKRYYPYPEAATNGNVELIERMHMSRELLKYVELTTAFDPKDYA